MNCWTTLRLLAQWSWVWLILPIAIAPAQNCSEQMDLSSLGGGIYRHHYLEIASPEILSIPLSSSSLNWVEGESYELLLWLRESTYENGGISLSLSGPNQLIRLVDRQSLKPGIYRLRFIYDEELSHLQMGWGNGASGSFRIAFLGFQRENCLAYKLGNEVPAPVLWLHPEGPFGPDSGIVSPNYGQKIAQWQSLGTDRKSAIQTMGVSQPSLLRDVNRMNGHPRLAFDGQNDLFSLDWKQALPQSDFTQFVVFRTRFDYGTMLAQANVPNYFAPEHQSEVGFRFGHLIHHMLAYGQNTYAQSYFQVHDNETHIGLIHVPDNSGRSLGIDGTFVGAHPANQHQDFLSYLLIGGQENYGYYNGEIAEILLFDESLSEKGLNQVYTYLALKYQIVLPWKNYTAPGGDTLFADSRFTHRLGVLGVQQSQFLCETEKFMEYAQGRLRVSAPEMPDNSYLFFADDTGLISIVGSFSGRPQNRIGRVWRIWQAGANTGQIQLKLESFPEGLQSVLLHPDDPGLPDDDELITYPLQQLGGGDYLLNISLPQRAFLSFSTEISPQFNVEWAGFEGGILTPRVVLEWATLSESHCASFQVERSLDGLIWQSVSELEASFNSDSLRAYRFEDLNLSVLAPGKLFYRIKAVDPIGAFKYSEVLEMELPPFESLYFRAQVLPSRELNIDWYQNDKSLLQAEIYNANGQLVWENSLGKGPQWRQQTFELDILSAGVYLLVLFTENARQVERIWLF